MEFPFMHKSGLEPLKAPGEAENFRGGSIFFLLVQLFAQAETSYLAFIM